MQMKQTPICGVYRITNIDNGKIYIGSSKDIKKRWQQHKKELREGIHANKYLQHAWNKYGEKCFVFDVLEKCTEEVQFQKEQEYLDTFEPFGERGYNIVHKISDDLVGGTQITKACECCNKEYKTFSHLSKYCTSCRDTKIFENWESYNIARKSGDYNRGFDSPTKRMILQSYGSMDYYWECNC